MATNRGNFRRPQEDYDNSALVASWNAWSLRRKRSKQSLLDDLIGIDPIVQKHMTISVTDRAALEAENEVAILQHQCQQYKLDGTKRYIIKNEVQVDVHRLTKHRRSPLQDQLSRVAKLRRLNYHKSKKVPSYLTNGGHCDNDNQYTFWRNLNALTGGFHGKTFDLTH